MPAIIEAESPTGEKTYIFAEDQSVMQRTRSTTDELCKGLPDSGFSSPTLTAMTPAMTPAMRRVQSGSDATLKRPRTEPSLAHGNLSEQTHLLLSKMMILEQKLKSMESQLKNEQLQRLTLEAKVVKLEESNQRLVANREKAGHQLQDFAEKFFAANDVISLKGSPSSSPRPSPYPSMADLNVLMRRRASRAESVSSNRSSQSRLSGISL